MGIKGTYVIDFDLAKSIEVDEENSSMIAAEMARAITLLASYGFEVKRVGQYFDPDEEEKSE